MKSWILICVFGCLNFFASAQPVITNFSPSSGSKGTPVTINGSGFNTTAANNIVYFGAMKAVVNSSTATQLLVTVPVSATYDAVSVTNLSTNRTAISEKKFMPVYGGIQPDITSSTFANPAGLLYFPATPRFDQWRSSANVIDLDVDGKPDIVVYSPYVSFSYLVNFSTPGGISFGPAHYIAIAANDGRCMTTADLDGDGKKDIILIGTATVSQGSEITVVRNLSTPGNVYLLPETRLTGIAPDGAKNVFVKDVNNDGKPDLIFPDLANMNIRILLNTSTVGDIFFSQTPLLTIPAGDVNHKTNIGLAVSDYDGDGKPDFAITDRYNNKLLLYLNTTTGGSFSVGPVTNITMPESQAFILSEDVDGDGKQDLCVAYENNADITVLKNTSTTGNISFNTPARFANLMGATGYFFSGPINFAFNDIDGDGKADLISGTGSVAKNKSTPGTISFDNPVTVKASSVWSTTADFDGDNRQDLAFLNSIDYKVWVAQNVAKPVLSSVSFTSNNTTNTGKAKTGDIVTVSIGSVNPIAPAITIAGHAATLSNTGNNWTGKYTMQTSDAEGTVPFTVTFTDVGGFTGLTVTTTTDNSNIVFDKTPPTVTGLTRVLPLTNVTKAPELSFQVVFSEPVINVTASSFQLTTTGTATGTIYAVSATSANSYTVAISGVTGNGNLRLDVKSSGSGVTDLSGNPLSGGFTAGESFIIDQTAKPTLNVVRIASNNTSGTALAKPGDLITLSFIASEPIATPVVSIAGDLAVVSSTGRNSWQAVTAMSATASDGMIPFSITFSDLGAIAGLTVTTTTDASSVTFDKTPPVVTSITRLTPASSSATNNTSLVYKVSFSEAVTNVTASAFQLTTTGSVSAVIGAVSVLSSTAVSVTVMASSSVGVLMLNLKNGGTGIIDKAGNANTTGFSGGEAFALDQVTQIPTLTDPVAGNTYYNAVVIKGSLPENYAPNSIRVILDNGISATSITLKNTVTSPFSIALNFLNPASTPEVNSGAAVTAGTYSVTVSYQDALGNPPAVSASSGPVVLRVLAAPIITPNGVTDIFTNTAKFSAEVGDNSLLTTVSVEYGTDSLFASPRTSTVSPTAIAAFTGITIVRGSLPGLLPETFYYYRIKAVNNLGTTYSDTRSFITTPSPLILDFTPVAAKTNGLVTITGAGFSAVTSVSFGGVGAQSFTVVSSTTIVAKVAGGATGAVSATSAFGSSAKAGFTFLTPVAKITSFTPASASAGTTVSIKGQDLSIVNSVFFGNTAARSFAIVSDTLIMATVDMGASGNVTLFSATDTTSLPGFTFIPAPTPVIRSFTPAAATEGDTVTIKGTGLLLTKTVRFGDINAKTFMILSDSVLKAVVDTGRSGAIHIVTPTGDGFASGFTYINPAPQITSFTPGSAALGDAVTIIGSHLRTTTLVRFGNITATSFIVDNDGQLRATVGSGASGDVTVVTAYGKATAANFNFIPATPVITAGGPLIFCQGLSVTLTSSVTGYDNQWYRNGIVIPNVKSATLQATLPGTYTVTAGNNGFVSSASNGVVISYLTSPALAKPTITGYTKDTLICFDNTASFTVKETYDRYIWSTGETTRSIIVPASTKVYVKVGTNAATCYGLDSSVVIDARKNNTPTPIITRSNDVLTSSSSNNYQWVMNNKQIAGATLPNFSLVSKGAYAVNNSQDGICWTRSAEYIVFIDPVPVKKAFDLTLYPNPSTGPFSIQVKFEKSTTAIISITISDQLGAVKMSAKKVLFSDRTMRIPINANLTRGTYTVKVDINGEVNTQQMIVQ